MRKTIDKELLNHILKLELNQQEEVLAYIKNMLYSSEINRRADLSEQAIAEGKVKSFDQFNSNFKNWKDQKREATK